MVNTRRDDLWHIPPDKLHKNYKICSDHFEPSQFMNEKKDRLIWNAEPRLFAVPNPPAKITPQRPPPKKRINSGSQQKAQPIDKKIKGIQMYSINN